MILVANEIILFSFNVITLHIKLGEIEPLD